MDVFPKFIIETYEQEGDCLIVAKCTYHKQLATDITKVKGGGWWTLDRDNSIFTLSGDSHVFGRAKIEDIASCVQRKKVFSSASLHRNFTDNFKFQYKDQCGEIFDLEVELIAKYGRVDLGTGTLVNLTAGGEGTLKRITTPETRYKMSIAKKGKKGLRQSKEQRQKTSELMKGVNSKKIINTKSGIIYNSIQEAAEQNNIKRATLSNYLTGRTKNKTNLKYY